MSLALPNMASVILSGNLDFGCPPPYKLLAFFMAKVVSALTLMWRYGG